MLVLSRKRDESIIIADEITITVVRIRRDTVRIGIEAPCHIPIHREEVYKEIHKEKEENEAKAVQPDQATT